jgi:hypothetical protein
MILRLLLQPLSWLCWFRPHKWERVPHVVAESLEGGPVEGQWDMCERCYTFRKRPQV